MRTVRLKNGKELRLAAADEVSGDELRRFYSIAYPERSAALTRYREWVYRPSPQLRVESPLLAVDDDGRVVAHSAFLPAKVGWGDRRLDTVWFVDYFVLDVHRGGGLGSALMREVMRAAPVVLAIGATKMSAPVFEHFGWRRIPSTQYLTLPIRPSRYPGTSGTPVGLAMKMLEGVWCAWWRARSRADGMEIRKADEKSVLEWAARHDDAQSATARTIRDSDFLRWRVLDYPFGGEFTVHSGDAGSALVRTYEIDGMRRATILGIDGRSPGAVARHLVAWALAGRIDSLNLLASDPVILRDARRWLPFAKKIPLYAHGEDPQVLDELARQPQGWEYIDSDLDLCRVDSRTEIALVGTPT